jgi:hypothetical protein
MDVRASVMARPALKPALRRVWRDASTLQIGLDPTHALIVGDVDDGLARWLEQLDGSKEFADALNLAADCGVESTCSPSAERSRMQRQIELFSVSSARSNASDSGPTSPPSRYATVPSMEVPLRWRGGEPRPSLSMERVGSVPRSQSCWRRQASAT